MNLEHELRQLRVDWPETPAFQLELGARREWRRFGLVAAVALAAIAAAFAVPESRGAILRFFHLGGVTIQIVDTLPAGQERPLASGLGAVVPLASAKSAVPRLLVPPSGDIPPLHFAPGNSVSMVFVHHGHPVLLTNLPNGGGTYLKKLGSEGTLVDPVVVGGDHGLWIHGEKHLFFFQNLSPRLTGDILLWEHGRYTYRLEGKSLTRSDAILLAESLRRG